MDVYRSIIITGGGGMLAHALMEALASRGLSAIPVRRADCDISNRADVARLFQQHRPSLVLNCAAHTGVDLCEDEPEKANAINGEGPGYLAEMAGEHHSRLVHFSTDFVFDGQNDRPYRPDDAPHPISAYGRSKFLGEKRVQQVSPPGWLILRTAWLFGRHGGCFPQTIRNMALAGRTLRVVKDQVGSPTSTMDLADATLRLLDAKSTGLVHVTNSGTTTWYDFAVAILKAFGLSADLAPVSTAEWLRMRPKQAKRPLYSVLDGTQYQAMTNHTLRHWTKAFEEYRAAVECEMKPA